MKLTNFATKFPNASRLATYTLTSKITKKKFNYLAKLNSANTLSNQDGFVTDYELTKPAESVADVGVETPKEPNTVTLNDVREAVTQSYLAEQVARMANRAAQGFAYTLYRDEIKRDSAVFNELLNEANLSLTEIEPYACWCEAACTLL